MAKIYNILKNSYTINDNKPFMNNLFYGAVTNPNGLSTFIENIVNKDEIKSVTISSDTTNNLFYITEKAEYEQDFKHGFAVQVVDSATGSMKFLTRESNEWKDTLQSVVKKYEKGNV